METATGKVDLSLAKPGDVCHLRCGRTVLFQGKTEGRTCSGGGTFAYGTHPHLAGDLPYTNDGCRSLQGPGDPNDITLVTRGFVEVTPNPPAVEGVKCAYREAAIERLRQACFSHKAADDTPARDHVYEVRMRKFLLEWLIDDLISRATTAPSSTEERGAATVPEIVDGAKAADAPAAVITGPGEYRTERYDRTNDAVYIAEVCGFSDYPGEPYAAVGLFAGCPCKWDRQSGKCHDIPDWKIAGPYVEPPKPPTLLEACETLFAAHRAMTTDSEGYVRVKVSHVIDVVEAAEREKGKAVTA